MYVCVCVCTASFSSTIAIQHRDRYSTEVTQLSFFFIEFIYIILFKRKIYINGSVYIVNIRNQVFSIMFQFYSYIIVFK